MNHRTNTTPHLHLIEPVAERNDTGWPEHRDVTPALQPIRNGQVVSVCSCGRKFVGIDPDHADWQLFDHIDNSDKTAN
ncbi:hypothetical protein [Kribbella sp. VKM Ac-2568]|uniref:hypothetical protein n=1 Tax=Kribbella sp. VKM Ac-2568 TaxID=2512219 RepID=UPI00104D28EF|nr:hypothetical protein [Kribbella sp. VKM Ac-2568]TCM35121.1 hypothetical protein EV648_12514 [Kribbella sp. VKM Ac-2568]